jgi:hypothetical protein
MTPVFALAPDSFTVRVLVLLHILCAIVGFGGMVLDGLFTRDAMQRQGDARLSVLQASWRETLVAEKFVYVVLLTGIVLAAVTDGLSFGDTWIWLSLVLFVVAMGVSHGVVLPARRTLLRAVREGAQGKTRPDEATLMAYRRKADQLTLVWYVLLVAIVALMIWRPGS